MLDILAMRKTLGGVSGEFKINGEARDKNFKFISAYVPQEDCFLPTLTVQQTLEYYADLLLGPSIPLEAKRHRIK